MIALIQRVTSAKVVIDDECVASIANGIVALIAVQEGDNPEKTKRMLTRLLNYRVFADDSGKMNLSILDVQGGLMLVPQFTLLADTNRGNRPSFSNNVPAEFGRRVFHELLSLAKQEYKDVQSGKFGADMQVSLINDGPVTFWLEV